MYLAEGRGQLAEREQVVELVGVVLELGRARRRETRNERGKEEEARESRHL